MRAFLAINLDGGLRERLFRDTAMLRTALPDASWVRAENLHLTLKFLGDVDEARAAALARALRPAVARLPVVDATLAGAGAFPDWRRARVIWIGIHDDQPVQSLAAKVEQACTAAGFPRERRPFNAHVTLARVRRPIGRDTTAAAAGAAQAFATTYPFRIGAVELMRSEPASQGSRYTVVVSLPLGAA